MVVGADHKVQWIKAGYGYDFVAGFHAQLNKALGLGGMPPTPPCTWRPWRTVPPEPAGTGTSSWRGRWRRKGGWNPPSQNWRRLRELDPNAVDVALELGEVLCRAGKNEAALKMAAQVKAESDQDKAHAHADLCAGPGGRWVTSTPPEALLTKALELDPESPRILYELGKVHQAKGDAEKALACYRRALAGIFGDADAGGASQQMRMTMSRVFSLVRQGDSLAYGTVGARPCG